MTANQIQYWRNVESERHNRESESAEDVKAEAQASQARTAHTNMIWSNTLDTLGFVIPKAKSTGTGLSKLLGSI